MKFNPILLAFGLIFTVSPSVLAQPTCTPFRVVEGQGYSVSKQVSRPGVIGRNNWNTDFVVSNQNTYGQFVVKIKSDSSEKAPFQVTINLKYADRTVDKAYDSGITLEPGQIKEIKVSPRMNNQPYQINVVVGGTGSMGFSYTASVTGCP